MQDAFRTHPDPVVFKRYHPNLVIRANDKRKMKYLLSNKKIRKLLLAQPDIYLSSHWRVIRFNWPNRCSLGSSPGSRHLV